MKRRNALAALSALAAAAALPVRAQTTTKLMFGYTAVTDFASVFVAAEEGYFKHRNLDVELSFGLITTPDGEVAALWRSAATATNAT